MDSTGWEQVVALAAVVLGGGGLSGAIAGFSTRIGRRNQAKKIDELAVALKAAPPNSASHDAASRALELETLKLASLTLIRSRTWAVVLLSIISTSVFFLVASHSKVLVKAFVSMDVGQALLWFAIVIAGFFILTSVSWSMLFQNLARSERETFVTESYGTTTLPAKALRVTTELADRSRQEKTEKWFRSSTRKIRIQIRAHAVRQMHKRDVAKASAVAKQRAKRQGAFTRRQQKRATAISPTTAPVQTGTPAT